VLAHVEVEPGRVMEPLRGAAPAWRVESDQVRPAVALPQTLRHRLDDGAMFLVFDRPVAADDPDERLGAVTPPDPFAVGPRVVRREDLRALAPRALHPLVAPGR